MSAEEWDDGADPDGEPADMPPESERHSAPPARKAATPRSARRQRAKKKPDPPWRFSTTARHYVVVRAIMASDLSSTEKLLLHTIEGHVTYKDRETGLTWPGLGTLATTAGIDRRTVYRLLKRLDALGWIEVTREKEGKLSKVNVYRVTPPEVPDTSNV